MASLRVLIAGCGYVGLATGAELIKRGHLVWGLRRSASPEQALRQAGIQPLHGDLSQPESLARLQSEFDWVVYCAAASGGGLQEYRATYIEGMRNLLARLAGAPMRKLVYTSSTSVYGQNDGSIVDERSPTAPAAETSQILVKAEERLLDAARQKRCPAVILRVAGIYGPGRGYWLRQFLSGEARLEGDGRRILNMVHRDDVAGAIIAALERGRSGEIYNVVDDHPATQVEVFTWLSERLNRALPPSSTEASHKRGVTNKRVSNQRLRTALGYKLKYPSFREGYEEEIRALGYMPK